jgi:hypothetical protein
VDINKRVKLQKNWINGFQDIALSRETGRGEGGGGGTRMNQKQYVRNQLNKIKVTILLRFIASVTKKNRF